MQADEERRARRQAKRIENQQAAYQSLKAEIIGVWRHAARYGETHQEIQESIQRIRSRPSYDALPFYLRSRLQGVQDAMFDLHYREVLVFTHVIDGVRYNAWHPTFAGRFTEVDETLSAHCYTIDGRYLPFQVDQRERDEIEGILYDPEQP